MQRHVRRSMCPRYVVNAANGGTVLGIDAVPLSLLWLSLALSGVGEVGRLWPRLDGSGVPDSLGGSKKRTPVGKSMMRSKEPGEFANNVTERSNGTTRRIYSTGRLIVRVGGKRVRNVE